MDRGIRASREHLKIALCAWESLYSVAVGGVAPHVSELARGLSKLGHEAHLYVRMGASNQKHYEIIDGVHVHRVPIELNSDFVKECVPVMCQNMCNGFMWFIGESEAYMQRCGLGDLVALQTKFNVIQEVFLQPERLNPEE
ncbi:hypothetical protein T484DRAFT_1781407 [Baffinella frigidus]|nr:hypothetical protein T484DRAFT_1781407 [Cryptophyta sp. CCMP2293]